MHILKFLLVAILVVSGSVSALLGFGIPMPAIEFKGLKAIGLPGGIVLIVAGVLVAHFWKVTTVVEKRIEGGVVTYIKETMSSILRPPFMR